MSGERVGVCRAPDMKLFLWSLELENCKMAVSGSVGREGSEGRYLGSFCLWTSHRVPLLQRDNRNYLKWFKCQQVHVHGQLTWSRDLIPDSGTLSQTETRASHSGAACENRLVLAVSRAGRIKSLLSLHPLPCVDREDQQFWAGLQPLPLIAV